MSLGQAYGLVSDPGCIVFFFFFCFLFPRRDQYYRRFFFVGFVVPGAPEGSTGRMVFVVVFGE